MNEFLHFFDENAKSVPMHFELYYSKTIDWLLQIWRKGTGPEGKDELICRCQDVDLDFVFAIAQIELKQWFRDHMGGY